MWEGIPESGAAWLRTRPLNETWLRLLVVPFGGGVLVGLLNTMRQSLNNTPENDKSESNSKAKSNRLADLRGVLRAFLKAVGAAVTLGTGCSLGPEGPSVEIGASIANGVGTVLSNSRERRLSLVAAGSAAGISSGFISLLPSTDIRRSVYLILRKRLFFLMECSGSSSEMFLQFLLILHCYSRLLLRYLLVRLVWMSRILTASADGDFRVQCGCSRVLFCTRIGVAAFVLRLGTVAYHSHAAAELCIG